MKLRIQFFGGRGANLSYAIPGGGGSNGKWSTTPGFFEPKSLKEAIGKKGRAMSIDKAAQGANPYRDPKTKYREYKENCQRVVVAYEARRRGYNVAAQPTYDGDILTHGDINGKGNDRWQGAFKGAKSVDVGATTYKGAQKNVEKQMKKYGNGARAVLSVDWSNQKDGHVLNVEQHKGKTYYVDAQTGTKYRGKDLFSVVHPSSVRLVRVDNLRFSDRMKKSVEKSGIRRSV